MCIHNKVNILRRNFVTSRFRENLSENPARTLPQSETINRKRATPKDEADEKVIVLS